MKKLIALIMVILMLFSVTAYADAYNGLIPNLKSGSIKINLTAKFEDVSEFKNIDGLEFLNTVLFCEGLSDLSVDYNLDYGFNDDYTAGRIAITSNTFIPLKINNNIEMTMKVRNGTWLIYDISDESEPVFQIIYLGPDDEKYVVYDVVELAQHNDYDTTDICENIKMLLNPETVEEYVDNIKTLYRDNSTLSEKSDGYVLTMTNDQLKNYISQVIPVLRVFSIAITDNDDFAFIMNDIFEDFFSTLGNNIEFNLVTEGKTDKNGNTQNSVSEMTISFDVEHPDGTIMSASVKLNEKYEYLPNNGMDDVVIPVLTEENSKYKEADDYLYDNYSYDDCAYIDLRYEYVPSAEETYYVSLDSIIGELKNNSHPCDVDYNGTTVVISDSEDTEYFDTAKLTVGSTEYEIDGIAFKAANPVVSVDNKIYVDNIVVDNIFGYKLFYANADIVDKDVYLTLVRRCPGYSSDDEIVYNPDSQFEGTCFHLEDLHVPINIPDFEEGYIGIRAAVETHCSQSVSENDISISYDKGVVTLKNLGSYENFKEARITVGSNIVYVDGVEHTVSLPAVNRNGTVYVDKQTIKAILNFEFESAGIRYDGNSYSDVLAGKTGVFSKYASFQRITSTCTHYKSVAEYYDHH